MKCFHYFEMHFHAFEELLYIFFRHISLISKDNYFFSAYINEYQIYKKNCERENSLTFSSSDIQNRCKDEKQICDIYFVLETNNKTESSVEFKVTSFRNTNSENFFKKNLKLILLIAGGVLFFLVIIIVILCLYKRKMKIDLSDEVNQISFGEEGERENTTYDEKLIT